MPVHTPSGRLDQQRCDRLRLFQAGENLEEVIKKIRGGSWTTAEPAYEFRNGNEVTKVFIEEGTI